MGSRIVDVGRFDSAIDANFARIQLEEKGIPSFVAGQQAGTMFGLPLGGPDGIRLQVREEDAERAVAVLEARTPAVPAEAGADEGSGPFRDEDSVEAVDLLDKAVDQDFEDRRWARRVRLFAFVGIFIWLFEIGAVLRLARAPDREFPPDVQRMLNQAYVGLWISIAVHLTALVWLITKL
jgi:hypothetical protein